MYKRAKVAVSLETDGGTLSFSVVTGSVGKDVGKDLGKKIDEELAKLFPSTVMADGERAEFEKQISALKNQVTAARVDAETAKRAAEKAKVVKAPVFKRKKAKAADVADEG